MDLTNLVQQLGIVAPHTRTFSEESSTLRLTGMGTVRGACGRAVEDALRRQQDVGFSHGLDDTTLMLEPVRPITVHYTKVGKRKGRRR